MPTRACRRRRARLRSTPALREPARAGAASTSRSPGVPCCSARSPALMNLRSRWSGIATGDQAIFVERAAFEAVGGFPDQPLMEDIELSRACAGVGRRPACARVSSPRAGAGNATASGARSALMWRLRLLYRLGRRARAAGAQLPMTTADERCARDRDGQGAGAGLREDAARCRARRRRRRAAGRTAARPTIDHAVEAAHRAGRRCAATPTPRTRAFVAARGQHRSRCRRKATATSVCACTARSSAALAHACARAADRHRRARRRRGLPAARGAALVEHDAVFGPARRRRLHAGGVRRPAPALLFDGVAWSTAQVMRADARTRLRAARRCAHVELADAAPTSTNRRPRARAERMARIARQLRCGGRRGHQTLSAEES